MVPIFSSAPGSRKSPSGTRVHVMVSTGGRVMRITICALIALVVVALCAFNHMLDLRRPRSSGVDDRLVLEQLARPDPAVVGVVTEAGDRAPSSSSSPAIHVTAPQNGTSQSVTSPQGYAAWVLAQLPSIFRRPVSPVTKSRDTGGVPAVTEVPKPLCSLPGTHTPHAHAQS